MNYSELDITKLTDEDKYNLVMNGVIDYGSIKSTKDNNPDFLVVLGCSPKVLKARILKMMELYKKGYGKYVLISGGNGWNKLFKPKKKTFKSDKEKFEYLKQIAKKRKEMKSALHDTIPNDIKPGINNQKKRKRFTQVYY